MKKAIIIHGTKGSPEGNWFPWLGVELEKRSYQVFIPKLPTPENQSVKNWCKALDEQAPRFDENTILIGHSCGATYILHILESMQKKVAKSIFVSGFVDRLGNEEYDELNQTFINHHFDWEKIIKNAGQITIFHGDNDPYVPANLAENFASKLKTPINYIKNGGHLNAEFGYLSFKEILECI